MPCIRRPRAHATAQHKFLGNPPDDGSGDSTSHLESQRPTRVESGSEAKLSSITILQPKLRFKLCIFAVELTRKLRFRSKITAREW